MDLADPDLPPGVVLPELSAAAPLGLNADRYRWLRDAFYELPRRSRVVIVLRMGLPGHQPLTLGAVGRLFGVGRERIRQLEPQRANMSCPLWVRLPPPPKLLVGP